MGLLVAYLLLGGSVLIQTLLGDNSLNLQLRGEFRRARWPGIFTVWILLSWPLTIILRK